MKKIQAVFLELIAILSVFVLVACENEKVVNDFDFEEFKVGEKLTLTSISGVNLTLVRVENGGKKGFVIENDEEKVLLIDFFGTFCAPCKEEAANLTRLWQQNRAKMTLIGLSHFESVSDEAVRKFAEDFGAYYFLSNESVKNSRLIAQILKDINYQNMEQLPFKVALKNGVYQKLSTNAAKAANLFYLGLTPTSLMQEDLERIFKAEN